VNTDSFITMSDGVAILQSAAVGTEFSSAA